MSKESVQQCPAFDVLEWDPVAGQRPWKQVNLHHFPLGPGGGDFLASTDLGVSLIFANANTIRKCDECRNEFIRRFRMPKSWWTDYSRKSNGYFTCHTSKKTIESWAYFEMKQLGEGASYRWYKLNVFIQWHKHTRRTTILSFETPEAVKPAFLEFMTSSPTTTSTPNIRISSISSSPFWFYPHMLSEVSRIQERAVWAIRDRVRDVEKTKPPPGRPNPDYRLLHDIARHAIHVSETLDVASQTIKRMITKHEWLMETSAFSSPSSSSSQPIIVNGKTTKNEATTNNSNNSDEDPSPSPEEIHSELQYHESFLVALRHRSISNEKRLTNEMQLAFATVAQHDAGTSVQIGRATQEDSVTMKSIAFVTLTFLPPTFVSAIFSMSFFDYDAEAGLVMSAKFWLYWAFAVPTTVLTAVAWWLIRRYASTSGNGSGGGQMDRVGGMRKRGLMTGEEEEEETRLTPRRGSGTWPISLLI